MSAVHTTMPRVFVEPLHSAPLSHRLIALTAAPSVWHTHASYTLLVATETANTAQAPELEIGDNCVRGNAATTVEMSNCLPRWRPSCIICSTCLLGDPCP